MLRSSLDAEVARHFAVTCRDVTPSELQGEVCVLHVPVQPGELAAQPFFAVISDAERRRAARFAKREDAARFVQRRAFRRFCGAVVLGCPEKLSSIVFEETSTGRPHLPRAPEHWFSFSSCGSGMIGAWSATCSVGVDLEDRAGNVGAMEIANQFFTEAEARAVRNTPEPMRLRAFLNIWCVKEAALKSIGEGLSYGLRSFAAELDPNLRLTAAPSCHGGPASFGCWRLQQTRACGALVTHRHA